jgi:multimeric flavodoxin WrbA
MKVLLLNGSPNQNGCTYTALRIIADRLKENGVDSTLIQIGRKPIVGCLGCGACRKLGRCVYGDDGVNAARDELEASDGLIVGSAVHYASATGALTSFLDRLFFSRPNGCLRMKFGAAVVSCRRGGATATFDQLNKYFTISQMPVVSSCYWNMVHGFTPQDVLADKEGVRTMQVLADNMAYLVKMRAAYKEPLPDLPAPQVTNFVREDLLREREG